MRNLNLQDVSLEISWKDMLFTVITKKDQGSAVSTVQVNLLRTVNSLLRRLRMTKLIELLETNNINLEDALFYLGVYLQDQEATKGE